MHSHTRRAGPVALHSHTTIQTLLCLRAPLDPCILRIKILYKYIQHLLLAPFFAELSICTYVPYTVSPREPEGKEKKSVFFRMK